MMNKDNVIVKMPVDNDGYTPLFNQALLVQTITNTLEPILEKWGTEKINRRDLAELYSVAKKVERSHNQMQLNMLKSIVEGA
tara:strand:+ start:174 stop:419 length:246 start_codon:yes stop_codon:yes gene_type:complete